MVIEYLVSRITDQLIGCRLTSHTLPYYLVGLCTTRQMEQREDYSKKVQTEQDLFGAIAQLYCVLPVKGDLGLDG